MPSDRRRTRGVLRVLPGILLWGALSILADRVEGASAVEDLGPIPHQDSPARFHARDTVLSADGRHVARVAYETETGTFFVTIDGRRVASGYDEIAHFSSEGPGVGGKIALSRDGSRFAFVGRQNGNVFLVVDGDRVQIEPARFNDVGQFLFSADGGHHVCAILSADGRRLAFAVGDRRRIQIDGTPITGEYLWFEFPSFSPDGEHFVAAGWDGETWDVLLDGRVVLSARHVFSDVPATIAFRGGALEALVVRGERFERHAIPLSGGGVTTGMAPESETPAPIATAAGSASSPRTSTDASLRATEHRSTTTEESRERPDREEAELRERAAEEEADLRERASEEASRLTDRITDTSKKIGRFFRKKAKQVGAGARGFKEGYRNAAGDDDLEDEAEDAKPPPSAPTPASHAGEDSEASRTGATPQTTRARTSTEPRRSSESGASDRAAGAATPGTISDTSTSKLPARLQRHVASGVLSPAQLEVKARCEEQSGSWLHDCGCIAGKPYVEAVWRNVSDISPPESAEARAREVHWSSRSSSQGLGRRLQVACESGGWGVGTSREFRLAVDLLEALGVPYNLERNGMDGRTAIPRMSPCEVLDVLRAADFDAMAVALTTGSYLLSIEKETVCRDRESIEAEAERDCSNLPLDVDCECYIEEYTELWMSGGMSLSSRSLSSVRSTAMQRCNY